MRKNNLEENYLSSLKFILETVDTYNIDLFLEQLILDSEYINCVENKRIKFSTEKSEKFNPDLYFVKREYLNEYIRRFIEQGTDIDIYSDEDILLMMNHINNTKREKLNGKSPYELMVDKFGIEVIKKLGFYFIAPKDIILKPNLFKSNNNK